jgi:type IV pilus biogenesis protein CpaD/CtpE
VALVATIGTITDGTYAFVIADSPDNSNWTTVSSTYLSGSFANATSAADDTVQEVGYLGTQRYIRVSVTVTGSPADGGPIAVSVIRAGARTLPQ